MVTMVLLSGCLDAPATPSTSMSVEASVREHLRLLYAGDIDGGMAFYNDTIVDLGGGDPCRASRAETAATMGAIVQRENETPTTVECTGDGANWTREDWREMLHESFATMERRDADAVFDFGALVALPYDGVLLDEHFTGKWWRPLVGDVQVRVPTHDGDAFFGWYRESGDRWRYVAGD